MLLAVLLGLLVVTSGMTPTEPHFVPQQAKARRPRPRPPSP